MRFALDTNVLIYGADIDAGHKHEQAITLIERLEGADCVLPLQVLAEFYHATTRKARLAPNRAGTYVARFRAVAKVVAASPLELDLAIAATEQHALSFWDAMLWATVRRAGCTLLLTEDFQDGRELGGVRFVNPFAAANRPVLDAALPPLT